MNTPRVVERTAPTELIPLELNVNGTAVSLEVPARLTLADLLRDRLGLTGTHVGCEHGVCGMCTVLVNGEATRACLLFACQADAADVVTVEGLGTPEDLHPLQEAFGRHHALQCGFCTPGFLMSSYDLLTHEPQVGRQSLPAELSGVLCRCTGYRNILDAVEDVATSSTGELVAPKNCGPRTLLGRDAGRHASTPGAETQAKQPTATERPDEIRLPQGEPKMNVEVTNTLASSPADVADIFQDLHRLIRCLPGAELTDDLGDGWYGGRARVALGPIRLKFDGVAHVLIHERDRLHVLAQGKDVSGGGAQAEIRLQSAPAEGGGTELQAAARVFLTGRVAGFGRSLAGDVSRRMFKEFADAVGQAAAGQTIDPVEPPSAVRIVLDALWGRWRARWRGGRQDPSP